MTVPVCMYRSKNSTELTSKNQWPRNVTFSAHKNIRLMTSEIPYKNSNQISYDKEMWKT
jgi:hypothetical protein